MSQRPYSASVPISAIAELTNWTLTPKTAAASLVVGLIDAWPRRHFAARTARVCAFHLDLAIDWPEIVVDRIVAEVLSVLLITTFIDIVSAFQLEPARCLFPGRRAGSGCCSLRFVWCAQRGTQRKKGAPKRLFNFQSELSPLAISSASRTVIPTRPGDRRLTFFA